MSELSDHSYIVPEAKVGTASYRQQLAKRNGARRTIYNADGSKYIGEWLDDKRHGYGRYEYRDGSAYVGEFVNGLRHGEGYMYLPGEQLVYQGSWFRDKMEGIGKYFYADGSVYEGEFQANQRHGDGLMVFPDGRQIVCHFEDDLENGHGIELLPNGDRYEGEWLAGKKHGRGILYFYKNKRKYQGRWENDAARVGEYCDWDEEDYLTFEEEYLPSLPNLPEIEPSEEDYEIPALGVKDGNAILQAAVEDLGIKLEI